MKENQNNNIIFQREFEHEENDLHANMDPYYTKFIMFHQLNPMEKNFYHLLNLPANIYDHIPRHGPVRASGQIRFDFFFTKNSAVDGIVKNNIKNGESRKK